MNERPEYPIHNPEFDNFYDYLGSAERYASNAHEGQFRRYTGESYITHPKAVAELVDSFWKEAFGEEAPAEVYAASLLHDVVEDTNKTLDDIERLFGTTVAQYVYFLTKPHNVAGNRKLRKAIFNNQLELAPVEVKIIKFFDMFHNCESIKEHDPKFFKVVREEMVSTLACMKLHKGVTLGYTEAKRVAARMTEDFLELLDTDHERGRSIDYTLGTA